MSKVHNMIPLGGSHDVTYHVKSIATLIATYDDDVMAHHKCPIR